MTESGRVVQRAPTLVAAGFAGILVALAAISWIGQDRDGRVPSGGQAITLDVDGPEAVPVGRPSESEPVGWAPHERAIPSSPAAARVMAVEQLRFATNGRKVGEANCERMTLGAFAAAMTAAMARETDDPTQVIAPRYDDLPQDLPVWVCEADVEGHGPSTALIPAQQPPRHLGGSFIGYGLHE